MLIITKDLLNKGRSKHGAFNKAQIELLGVQYEPPFNLPHQWLKKLIGQQIDEKTAQQFIALKDSHLI